MTCLIAPYAKAYAFCMLCADENFIESLSELRKFIKKER